MHIPHSIFNCKIKFNPFQYLPYFKLKDGKNYLYIADEVGLGKTIEAGIILKEELLKNEEFKCLIIAPKFLCTQWEEQLFELFDIDATILEKGEIRNIYDNVYILPLSMIKKFNEVHNGQKKFDLVIVDEAHYFRNGEKTSRYTSLKKLLGERKSDSCKTIFMSATPINNYASDWNNQICLLSSKRDNFNEENDVIRSRKCIAFPLSKIRNIETYFVGLEDKEQKLYDTTDVTSETEFGKTIYRHIGASSLYALKKCYENNGFDYDEEYQGIFEDFEMEEDYLEKVKYEIDYGTIDFQKVDSKLNSLIKIVTNDKFRNKKIIVFAHYIETCNHIYDEFKLHDGLEDCIFTIKGQMSFKDQKSVRDRFEEHSGKAILVCSDVCKEGVNLQCASVLINYDLPYNPSILEQRIGRIDRVGQKNDIYIYNFVTTGTYDDSVYWQILLGKLAMINQFAKKGRVNPINVNESNMITDFEKAVRNKINSAKDNLEELKYVFRTLKIYFNSLMEKEEYKRYVESKEISIIEDIESYKALINKFIEKIKSLLEKQKQDEQISLYKIKEREVSKHIFEIEYEDIDSKIKNHLKEKLGNPTSESEYKFEINVDKEKVKELLVKKPSSRIFLKHLIEDKYRKKVFEMLEDNHTLLDITQIEIKDKFIISYEYVNSRMNYEENLNLSSWDKYCQNFVPIDILITIKK